MPYYPDDATGLNHITYPTGPTAVPTVVTSSASTNTKGSYVQIVASTAFTSNFAHIRITRAEVSRRYLFDVATGAGGSETVVAPDLCGDNADSVSSVSGQGLYSLPLAIASGTRIAARCQATTGSTDIHFAITLTAAGSVAGISSWVNYGSNTSNSLAVELDPGGTINTKGSYAEITSSTSAIAQFVCVMFTRSHAQSASASWAVDIATGAGGAETVLIPDIRESSGTNGVLGVRSYGALTYIPSSTRIAGRSSCSINTATTRLIQVALLAGEGSGTDWYPQSSSGLAYSGHPAGPTAAGATVTTGAQNVKGSYTELVSSAGFIANSILFRVLTCDISNRYLVDIATGAGGAETVVVPNLVGENASSAATQPGQGLYTLPLAVASGARVSCRAQSSAAAGSQVLTVSIHLIAAGNIQGIPAFTNYGADTATSLAVQVDPGGTANTKGSYSQITASTAEVTQFLCLMVARSHSQSDPASWAVDLATGAGGAETVLIPDIRQSSADGGGTLGVRSYSFVTYIPASTRLAGRASSSLTIATPRTLTMAVMAAVEPPDPELLPPTIASTEALFAPVVGQSVSLPAISSTALLFAPTVSISQSVTTPTIPSGALLYAPTVDFSQAVTLPTISSGTVLRAPDIDQPFILGPGDEFINEPDTRVGWITHPDNLALTATVTATDEDTNFPISNVSALPSSSTWRTPTLGTGTDSIHIDLGAATPVDIIALVNHNLTSGAEVEVRAGTSTSVLDFLAYMDWREFTAFRWLSTAQTYRYWRIIITDPLNPDDFMEVGYVVIGLLTKPDPTFRQGWTTTPDLTNSRVVSEFGQPTVEEMFRRQRIRASFGPVTDAEFQDLMRAYKTTKRNAYPLLFLPERGGTDAYFGRLENILEQKLDLHRYADISFVEDSFGHSLED